eukprot:CAMPEP_0194308508 /NCGR_PEP_ID=MMETSP0171-20130528/5483_1 /TAXON_ID=218684 /ORGANISM="Corethron pennatum, Strain L29A3" /LENGTH=777 /DNA_ID=CAMNT_0039061193 /DNA_START=354 /DNA_END=2684 /DNA_ORIENTATION=-
MDNRPPPPSSLTSAITALTMDKHVAPVIGTGRGNNGAKIEQQQLRGVRAAPQAGIKLGSPPLQPIVYTKHRLIAVLPANGGGYRESYGMQRNRASPIIVRVTVAPNLGADTLYSGNGETIVEGEERECPIKNRWRELDIAVGHKIISQSSIPTGRSDLGNGADEKAEDRRRRIRKKNSGELDSSVGRKLVSHGRVDLDNRTDEKEKAGDRRRRSRRSISVELDNTVGPKIKSQSVIPGGRGDLDNETDEKAGDRRRRSRRSVNGELDSTVVQKVVLQSPGHGDLNSRADEKTGDKRRRSRRSVNGELDNAIGHKIKSQKRVDLDNGADEKTGGKRRRIRRSVSVDSALNNGKNTTVPEERKGTPFRKDKIVHNGWGRDSTLSVPITEQKRVRDKTADRRTSAIHVRKEGKEKKKDKTVMAPKTDPRSVSRTNTETVRGALLSEEDSRIKSNRRKDRTRRIEGTDSKGVAAMTLETVARRLRPLRQGAGNSSDATGSVVVRKSLGRSSVPLRASTRIIPKDASAANPIPPSSGKRKPTVCGGKRGKRRTRRRSDGTLSAASDEAVDTTTRVDSLAEEDGPVTITRKKSFAASIIPPYKQNRRGPLLRHGPTLWYGSDGSTNGRPRAGPLYQPGEIVHARDSQNNHLYMGMVLEEVQDSIMGSGGGGGGKSNKNEDEEGVCRRMGGRSNKRKGDILCSTSMMGSGGVRWWSGGYVYFVHYMGWSARWDRWVGEADLCEISQACKFAEKMAGRVKKLREVKGWVDTHTKQVVGDIQKLEK